MAGSCVILLFMHQNEHRCAQVITNGSLLLLAKKPGVR